MLEAIRQKEMAELALLQRQAEQEQANSEREASRLAAFEPALEKARQLQREGLITQEQLAAFEQEPQRAYSSASSLGYSVDAVERVARANKERLDMINAKYDQVTAQKLINRQIEPGMTREQLIDAMGNTIKTEKTLTKSGERETLIYGSKTTGSYFHIEGGVIVKAVVR